MKAVRDDMRQRIHDTCEAGDGTAEVAGRFAVSEATVRWLKRRFCEDGTLARRPDGRGPAPTPASRMADLAAAVAARPGDTPAEHADRRGLGVSRGPPPGPWPGSA